MPKWVLLARARNGDWQIIASISNIREVQLILPTLLGVKEARLCRLESDRTLDLTVGVDDGVR